MDSLLVIKPGLIIWTIINFGIFLFLILKFGGKGILNAVKQREDSIAQAINAAEEANRTSQKLLKESQEKIDMAQQEVALLIQKGREQSEANIRKATEEAEAVKRLKVEEAVREIERSKEKAIIQLKTEVADMVVNATEKILTHKLDKDNDMKLVENYINNLPKN